MMSLEVITRESRRQAARSAKLHLTPLLVQPEDVEDLAVLKQHLRSIPFLGDRTPKGYKFIDLTTIADEFDYRYSHFFVDMTGWGRENEPALTQDQFVLAVQKLVRRIGTIGLSIMEIGQFQGHIRVTKQLNHKEA